MRVKGKKYEQDETRRKRKGQLEIYMSVCVEPEGHKLYVKAYE